MLVALNRHRLLFALVMSFIPCAIFSLDSHAERPVPKYELSEAFLYFSDVIKSLSQMQRANQHLVAGTEAVKETAGGNVHGISGFVAETDSALEELMKAKTLILPYEKSPNHKIRESARGLASGYEALRGFHSRTQKVLKDLYGGHPKPFNLEQFATAFIDVDLEGQRARALIAKSCIAAAQALVEYPRKGAKGNLVISSEERDVLVSNIHSVFPKTQGKRWGSETEIDEAMWKILRLLEESPAKDEAAR